MKIVGGSGIAVDLGCVSSYEVHPAGWAVHPGVEVLSSAGAVHCCVWSRYEGCSCGTEHCVALSQYL